jgi:hypothetical protein
MTTRHRRIALLTGAAVVRQGEQLAPISVETRDDRLARVLTDPRRMLVFVDDAGPIKWSSVMDPNDWSPRVL